MSLRRLCHACCLMLLVLTAARAATDEAQIRAIVGKDELLADRVSGPWAIAFWAEPRGKGGDGVTLLHRVNGTWKKVKDQPSWTRAQLKSYNIDEADIAMLGFGDVPKELIGSLAYEVNLVQPGATTYRVATFGRSRFALTNQGDIWSGKQVVWQRIQEKWSPIFSYDGGKLKRSAREKLYAKEGLSLYMELLLINDGQSGTLPKTP